MSPGCRDVETFLVCAERFHVATLSKTFPSAFTRNVSTSAPLRRRGNVFSMRRRGNVSTWKRQLRSPAWRDVETFDSELTFRRGGVSTSTPTGVYIRPHAPTWKRLTWKRFAPKCPTWKRSGILGGRFHVGKTAKRFHVETLPKRETFWRAATWKRFDVETFCAEKAAKRFHVHANAWTWKRSGRGVYVETFCPRKTFPRRI